MNIDISKIQDADLKDKIVLLRVDHNVVKHGKIFDPYRIDETLGTLYYINAKGGKIILMSHVGRPRNKKGEISISSETSIEPIVEYLKKKLHIQIGIAKFPHHKTKGILGIDTSINHDIRDLKEHKLDILYLPNTRWFNGEEGSEEEKDRFAYQLAGLADIFINDAFGSWRSHASTYQITKYLKSYAGFLMQKEIEHLNRVFSAKKPFLSIIAGSKFDTKIEPLFSILQYSDYLILGGVIYNAYLAAKYDVKIKGIAKAEIDYAKKFVEFSKKFPNKIIELPYIIESKTLSKIQGEFKEIKVSDLKNIDELDYILDVSKKSFLDEKIRNVFLNANTIFVNAVMGFVPQFADGTIGLDELIDNNKNATKLYGGGDTMQELKRLLPGLYIMAIDHPKYCIFTGGGAVLKAIQHQSAFGLEPINILQKK